MVFTIKQAHIPGATAVCVATAFVLGKSMKRDAPHRAPCGQVIGLEAQSAPPHAEMNRRTGSTIESGCPNQRLDQGSKSLKDGRTCDPGNAVRERYQ